MSASQEQPTSVLYSGRGGDRGGRRPKGRHTQVASFELGDRHLTAIADWAEQNGCRSRSEALRQMIDALAETQSERNAGRESRPATVCRTPRL